MMFVSVSYDHIYKSNFHYILAVAFADIIRNRMSGMATFVQLVESTDALIVGTRITILGLHIVRESLG